MPKYNVIRDHGTFRRGDTRTAAADEVQHLVDINVLKLAPAKAAAPVANKAKPRVRNKAITAPKNK